MTSDPAKPETFRSHLPAIVAATVGTVLATIFGSLMGTAGTVAGMTFGSLVSGTFSWWAERGIRRSAEMTAARAAAIRARGRPLSPEEDAAVTQVFAAQQDRARPRRRWVASVALAAAVFIGCAVTVTLLEHAAGKPLSALVEGKSGHGTTFGGGHTGGTGPASPAPKPSASTTGPTATAPASPASPAGHASSSPAASPTPDATPGSTRPTVSTTPSALPTGTATVPAPGPVSSSAHTTGG